MVDGSYLFIPDNERYENSKIAVFDGRNRPISRDEEQELSESQRKRCRLRRYYQMVSLSHTDRNSDYLLYCGAKVLRSGAEVHQLVPLVSDFVDAAGKGVMKTLLVDRGFIHGRSLER